MKELLLLSLLTCARSYLPKRPSEIKGSVHGKILRDGIGFLDSLLESGNSLRSTLQLFDLDEIYHGISDADYEEGSFKLFSQQLPRNEMSHFYNPDLQTGGRFLTSIPWLRRLERYGWLRGGLSLLIGPSIPSTQVAAWYYERAVYEWNNTDLDANNIDSMRSLGMALHVVMDATVPHQAADCGDDNSNCRHRAYEQFVEERYDEWRITPESSAAPLPLEQILSLSRLPPEQMVVLGAKEAAEFLDKVTRRSSFQKMEEAARYLIPIAQQLVATLLYRFLNDIVNQEVHEEAVVLMIRSIQLEGSFGEKSPADFQPIVRNSGQVEIRGFMANTNTADVSSSYNPATWTYVQWLPRELMRSEAVPVSFFSLEVFDVVSNFPCTSSCRDVEKAMVLGTDGRTRVQVSLAFDELSEHEPIWGSTSGCDTEQLQSNGCQNAVKVTWVIGRSRAIGKIQSTPNSEDVNFQQIVTSKGLLAIVGILLSMCFMCLCCTWGVYKGVHYVWLDNPNSHPCEEKADEEMTGAAEGISLLTLSEEQEYNFRNSPAQRQMTSSKRGNGSKSTETETDTTGLDGKTNNRGDENHTAGKPADSGDSGTSLNSIKSKEKICEKSNMSHSYSNHTVRNVRYDDGVSSKPHTSSHSKYRRDSTRRVSIETRRNEEDHSPSSHTYNSPSVETGGDRQSYNQSSTGRASLRATESTLKTQDRGWQAKSDSQLPVAPNSPRLRRTQTDIPSRAPLARNREVNPFRLASVRRLPATKNESRRKKSDNPFHQAPSLISNRRLHGIVRSSDEDSNESSGSEGTKRRPEQDHPLPDSKRTISEMKKSTFGSDRFPIKKWEVLEEGDSIEENEAGPVDSQTKRHHYGEIVCCSSNIERLGSRAGVGAHSTMLPFQSHYVDQLPGLK